MIVYTVIWDEALDVCADLEQAKEIVHEILGKDTLTETHQKVTKFKAEDEDLIVGVGDQGEFVRLSARTLLGYKD